MDFEPINKLLNKKMSRKEFLTHIGAAMVAVSGISALIKSITDPRGRHRNLPGKDKKNKSGYGQSPYGI